MCSILSGEFSLMQLRSALSSLSREDRLTGKLGKKISMFLLRVVSSRVFISVRTRAVRAGRGDTSDIHTSLIMTTYNCSHCTGTCVNIALSRFQHTLYCYTEVGTYICTAAHADGQQADFWPYADSQRLGVGTLSQDYSILTADCRNLQ